MTNLLVELSKFFGEYFEYCVNEKTGKILVHDINTTANAPCWYEVSNKKEFDLLKKGLLKPVK